MNAARAEDKGRREVDRQRDRQRQTGRQLQGAPQQRRTQPQGHGDLAAQNAWV